jgi:hypothetical protein
MRAVSYHRRFLRIRRRGGNNVGMSVIVGSAMGVVEAFRDCECRTARKIGAGRCEAKKVEREGYRLIRCWWLRRCGMEGERAWERTGRRRALDKKKEGLCELVRLES